MMPPPSFCPSKRTMTTVVKKVKPDVGKVQSLLLRLLPVDKLWQRLKSLQTSNYSSAKSLAKDIKTEIVRRKGLRWINDKEREEAAASAEAMQAVSAMPAAARQWKAASAKSMVAPA